MTAPTVVVHELVVDVLGRHPHGCSLACRRLRYMARRAAGGAW